MSSVNTPPGLEEFFEDPAADIVSGEDKVKDWVGHRLSAILGRDGSLSGFGDADAATAEPVYRRPDISLRDYLRLAWPFIEPNAKYVHNWHIDAIADHLEAVTNGDITRLIINVPPRHMKSISVGVCWPTWTWTFRPEVQWLFASNAQPLATRDATKSRRLIQTRWYQENWGHRFNLTSDQNAKMRYENDQGGTRLTSSTQSSVIGEGGSILVGDDLNKPGESNEGLEAICDYYDSEFSTRKNDPLKSAIVLIQQRLHERDITGHVLMAEDWVHLRLPSEYEKKLHTVTVSLKEGDPPWEDPRSQEGELLWPERWTQDLIDQEKRRLGTTMFNGQHQQRPSSRGGNIFMRHWWKFWHPSGHEYPKIPLSTPTGDVVMVEATPLPPLDEMRTQLFSWDMAFKNTEDSSYVVGQLWAQNGPNFYLVYLVRGHFTFTETLSEVIKMAQRYPYVHTTLVEDKANGTAVINTLQRHMPGIIAVEPKGGKESRANAVSPSVEAGNVYLPHPLMNEWVDGFIDECASFPNGLYDDQVDAASQALNRLLEGYGQVHFLATTGF